MAVRRGLDRLAGAVRRRLSGDGAAEAFVERLLAGLPAAKAAELRAAMEERRRWYGERLFDGVSDESRPNPEYVGKLWDEWKRTIAPGTVHLELGVWKAWPDERAEAYVAEERIGDVIRLDYDTQWSTDVAASATALPFAEGSLDRVSSNSLFEHVLHADEIVYECHRVLKPGGIFNVTVPFHFVQHGCPNDYLRFTGQYFEELCREAGFETVVVDTRSASGAFYTLHNLAKSTDVGEPADGETAWFLSGVRREVLRLLGGLQAFDDQMAGAGADHYHSVRCFAVKPGTYAPDPRPIDRSVAFVERHLDRLVCPATWAPLRPEADTLVTPDGSRTYPLVNGRPDLRTAYGPNSRRGLLERLQRIER